MNESGISRSKRILKIFEGICLILLAVAMSLNMGYVMRSINAAFIFLSGHCVILFIALFIYEGFSLIIRSKAVLPKKSWKYLPILIIALCIYMFVSTIELQTFDVKNDDIIRTYIASFNNFEGGYYTRNFINIFQVPFGGGLFGYLLAIPFVLLAGKIGAICISGVLLAIMLLILTFPYLKIFRSYLKERKERSKEKAEEKKNRPKEEPREKIEKPKKEKVKKPKKEKIERPKTNTRYTFIEETDVFANARDVGENEVTPTISNDEIIPVSFTSLEEEDEPIRTIRSNSDTGTLEKAQINLFNEFNEEPREEIKETPIEAVPEPIFEEPIEVEEEKEQEAIDSFLLDEPVTEEIIETKEEEIIPPSLKEEVVTPKKEDVVVVKKEAKPKKVEPVPPPPAVEEPESQVEWIPPSTEALMTYQTEEQIQKNIDAAKEKMEIVNQAFIDFKIDAQVVDFVIGPSITLLLIDYSSTASVKAVDRVKTDVARRLRGIAIRFLETVPDTQYSGFEVPNPVKATVSFKEVYEGLPDAKKHPTAVAFGKDIMGEIVYADICEFPHLLVSGTSGSGKSVFVNSLITTLIGRTSPKDLRLVLVDPKQIEMNKYDNEPHLLCPVITDARECKVMLEKMADLMNERYAMFREADLATSIKDYNFWCKENGKPTIPYIIVILDEYADLVYSCKEVSHPLVSITAKARACGIHIIVSTQRPSVDVITGTIKANLNARVSLMAASATDSTTILDEGGAEDLLGNGDMLVKSPLVTRKGLRRIQGCYIQPKEIMYMVNFSKQNYKVEYMERFLDLSEKEDVPTGDTYNPGAPSGDSDEEKYLWIRDWALTEDYVSMSKIQRSCNVGFNRAGKIVKRLQDEGVLSTIPEGSNKGFKVLGGESRFYSAPDVDSGEQTNGGKK